MKNNPPLRMLIIGGEDQQTADARKLRKLSQELGVRNQVTFVGRVEQEELPRYYSAADFLVIPSRYESFGLVALESLACGTPVVSTRVGAMEKIIQEGVTGHIVNSNSPQSLAKGIEFFAPVSSELSGEAIRASVLGFGWENVTSALVNEYETLLSQQ
jgi:D-inositol-3-phosphate glycosyltransferase